MKTLMLFLALMVLPAFAEDWTVNGKNYHNVKVFKVDSDKVQIMFDGGAASIALADLSADQQKRFKYDPEAAAKAKNEAIAAAEKQKEIDVASSKASVRVIQVSENGFLGVVFTKWGTSNPGFVKGNTKGMIDGGLWSGIVVQAGTFSYTDTQGAQRTVSQFEIAPNTQSSFSSEQVAPPRPVSSSQSVGGG